MFLYVLLKLSDMSGSAVCVDVDTIRIIADHMRLRTEGVKYVLCDGKALPLAQSSPTLIFLKERVAIEIRYPI